MDEQLLEKLGFTRGESKVYLALLKLGNVTSGPVVEESGISKSKVYEILERLTKKGIVSQVIERGVMYFQPVQPKRLSDMLAEKEEELQTTKKSLASYMPELEAQFNSIKEKQEVSVLKGSSGLRTVFNDILRTVKKGDEYIVFCAVEPPDDFKPFLIDFSSQRAKQQVRLKVIFNKNTNKNYLDTVRKDKYSEVKTIFPEFNTPAVFNLYSNKTAIILWSKKPVAIIIENQEITNSFKKYFEILWKIAKI